MDGPYKERGGAMVSVIFGYLSATWPFALITISDKLILTVGIKGFLEKRIELNFSDITEVRRNFWFPYLADGVRIPQKRRYSSVNYFLEFGECKENL